MQFLSATHEKFAIIKNNNNCKLNLTFSVSVNLAALSHNMALTAVVIITASVQLNWALTVHLSNNIVNYLKVTTIITARATATQCLQRPKQVVCFLAVILLPWLYERTDRPNASPLLRQVCVLSACVCLCTNFVSCAYYLLSLVITLLSFV